MGKSRNTDKRGKYADFRKGKHKKHQTPHPKKEDVGYDMGGVVYSPHQPN